jgi:site-specific DNA-cytosine methylase
MLLQIGNAVPPTLAEALMGQIARTLRSPDAV